MHILLVEPYYAGSHAAWAAGYAAHSRHQVSCLTMPGRFWKWRMHGGAVALARRLLAGSLTPDVILATDMLDVATFLALTRRRTHSARVAIYFHENQLNYPWPAEDRDVRHGRDIHYAFINYTSALAADAVFFNSHYHMEAFFDALPRLLKHFPDYRGLATIEALRARSQVLPLGLELRRLDAYHPASTAPTATVSSYAGPIILWNHRWEYDKNPGDFFRALYLLVERGFDFRVVILGQGFRQRPAEFFEAAERLGSRLLHMGYVSDFASYASWLWQADVLPVTSYHDFFGVSVVEAIYCGCWPLLPRRLSYPELIPPEYHAVCFYDDFDDLVERLQTIIASHRSWDATPLQRAMARFDWQHMAPVYDQRLEWLCQP